MTKVDSKTKDMNQTLSRDRSVCFSGANGRDKTMDASSAFNKEDDNDAKALKRKVIQRDRHTTIYHPMTMEMYRRTRLSMKSGEVEGLLKFHVSKSEVLHLPPSEKEAQNEATNVSKSQQPIASVRETFFRRVDALHPSRKEDDAPYIRAIEKNYEVTLVAPLPCGYEHGGWRCHSSVKGDHLGPNGSFGAANVAAECLHPNISEDERCVKCQSIMPVMKPEFARLRLLSPGMRNQCKEYLQIIQECDSELERCEAAEKEARKRICAVDGESTENSFGESNDLNNANIHKNEAKFDVAESESSIENDIEDPLMMDIDLVQRGVWQRVNSRSLIPMLEARIGKSKNRLAEARAELCIMIQSAYQLAVPHAQKIVRGFVLRSRLPKIRQSVLELAQFSAAVKIQKLLRSKLAIRKTDRLRKLRECFMATRIQSIARRRRSILERNRRWEAFIDTKKNEAATKIQSLYRCRAAMQIQKLLSEERKRRIEEIENARLANVEKDSAVVIQKHFRRCLSKSKCANRKVELSLHGRLLMYLERFRLDGCLWSFMKSINDDYIRYERTIQNTIEREEKYAKTFVEKVTTLRDVDHCVGWEQYNNLKNCDNKPTQAVNTVKETGSTFVSPVAMAKKVALDDAELRKPKPNDGREWELKNRDTARIYGSRVKSLRVSAYSRRNQKQNCGPKNHTKKVQQDHSQQANQTTQIVNNGGNDDTSALFAQEEKRLASLEQVKDRLRGQYLHFDIPDGLDDTVARFIVAVTLRYKFEDPSESSLHGNFAFGSLAQNNLAKKQHHKACMLFAEPLIQSLHGQGFIFIRQLIDPSITGTTISDNLSSLLSTMGVSEYFLVLCNNLLKILQQVGTKEYLSRKYLMWRLSMIQTFHSDKYQCHSNLVTFIGECGAAGCNEFDDGDHPGGMWKSRYEKPNDDNNSNYIGETPSGKSVDPTSRDGNVALEKHVHKTKAEEKSPKRKCWVIPYLHKIFHENEQLVYGQYRQGPLLADKS